MVTAVWLAQTREQREGPSETPRSIGRRHDTGEREQRACREGGSEDEMPPTVRRRHDQPMTGAVEGDAEVSRRQWSSKEGW
jgi:hypothetical protein